MNVTEMHIAIQQGVDKINSLQADSLLSEEIDIELNKNMFRFINTKYGRNNMYRKGFEESQKRIDDLRTLVREYEAPVSFKEQLKTKIFVDTFFLHPPKARGVIKAKAASVRMFIFVIFLDSMRSEPNSCQTYSKTSLVERFHQFLKKAASDFHACFAICRLGSALPIQLHSFHAVKGFVQDHIPIEVQELNRSREQCGVKSLSFAPALGV